MLTSAAHSERSFLPNDGIACTMRFRQLAQARGSVCKAFSAVGVAAHRYEMSSALTVWLLPGYNAMARTRLTAADALTVCLRGPWLQTWRCHKRLNIGKPKALQLRSPQAAQHFSNTS